MATRNIIVIGASMGGFEAFKRLVADLPPDIDASIFLVWHMSPHVEGILPKVLGEITTIPVAHAEHGEPILPNRIYVARPDHHLLVDATHVHVTRGPRENRFRPAIDPLFRSAAYAFGNRVIGAVLTGALDDGTAGLWSIKRCGGIAIAQDPEDADMPSMPENAIREVAIDYIVPISEMAALLARLCCETVDGNSEPEHAERDKMGAEVRVAADENTFDVNIPQYGEVSKLSCPECQGVLTMLKDGQFSRYRCHTGHAFSPEALLEAISEKIENNLFAALRGVDEHVMLLNHMGDHFAEANQRKEAARYFRKAREAQQRVVSIRRAIRASEDHDVIRVSEERL
ncbi:two-component system, chemotaxis family, response regulator CheB [Dyadobacter soli]|uniref:protein-glutamate methylesterase n=1 Tax=Dyadobacter soli TaxID=659014 RepID=A0A1G7D055_9BACT|nr:chemotaxis protein CheB [Dyadobacter soli]SDE44853.1 two-component system, chemotaxis family, response regulator CheB [Dyadobacter soli]